MSRCASFWHKFESEGNFCGMDPTEISRVKSYLEFVAKLEKAGLEKDLIYTNFAVGAARPLISVSDDETRVKGLNYVAACLKRKERVTAGDLRSSIKVWLEQEQNTCPLNARSENLENSKIKDQAEPEIKKEPQIEKVVEPVIVLPPPLSEIADLSKLPPLSPDAPMDEVMKRDELLLKIHNVPSEFKTGSEIQKEVINGGLVTKPLPYKISPEPMAEKEADELILQVINRWFAPKSKELWETILTSGELSDSPARLFEALVCRIGGE